MAVKCHLIPKNDVFIAIVRGDMAQFFRIPLFVDVKCIEGSDSPINCIPYRGRFTKWPPNAI